MKLFLTTLLMLGATFAHAVPEACENALRRALDADGAFRMVRVFPETERVLVSTGVVSCAKNRGIVWDVRHPFPASVTMTTNAMIFVDDEGRREKPLKELPHYDEIRRRTDAFVAGDAAAFKGLFEIESEEADARWRITFTPESRAMRQLLKSITISGSATLEKAVLSAADGSTSTITFTELGVGSHVLWKEAAP